MLKKREKKKKKTQKITFVPNNYHSPRPGTRIHGRRARNSKTDKDMI